MSGPSHPQPPGPGWWQARDGRWYPPRPPQQQYQQQQYPPQAPPPKRSNRGCLIAVLVVVGLVLVGGGVATYLVVQAAQRISATVGDGIIGSAQQNCPPTAEISAAVGSPLRDPIGGTLVGSTGCAYLAVDQSNGIDVNIVTSPALIADEQFKDFSDEGMAAGATPVDVALGDRGQAWAADHKSAAIGMADGRVVLVELMATGAGSLDDRTQTAIDLARKQLG
ncbi:hypothetical protein [Pseudonocardia sp. TRM90224]|uniref:hypothetical protein n=1 Tax=Pseudonocardia sp. TRM90224 TaxID=2812678 RepID=UPI001E5268B3|nr:hypothetical protein [Pseudonocardia sp. TRM90224]